MLRDGRLEGDVESVRFVTTDAAVVHWTGAVEYPWQRRVKPRRPSRQTLVVVAEMGMAGTRFIRWRGARAQRRSG